jgi:hypothetical protein
MLRHSQGGRKYKKAGVKMELLSEHSTRNNFFKLLDEVHEDWKDKYDQLITKGRR